jgi:hypothetical protein
MSLQPPPAPPKLYAAWISDEHVIGGITRTQLVGWSFTDGGAFACTNIEGIVWARQLRPGDTVRIAPDT